MVECKNSKEIRIQDSASAVGMAEKNSYSHTFLILWILLFSFPNFSKSLPLSTSGRWIVDDETGNRVKLTCVNWVGHLEPLIVEGIQKKPLSYIVDNVVSMGFNCVRLTWATFMFTRENSTNLSVRESLNQLNLNQAIMGIETHNPGLIDATVVDVQKAVVHELGKKSIMVVLDNQVSKPEWCCNQEDGNGFFGDEFFDTDEWLQGLTTVANLYKDTSNVIAMSLRNELRGPRQNTDDWYEYIPRGASAVHGENPRLLILVSGLSYETDLSFVNQKPLVLDFSNKLVYEAHWYGFFSPGEWLAQTNQMCAQTSQSFKDNSAFVLSSNNPVPLFLSEYGVDQRGVNEADNRYLSCLAALVAEYDLDWALWALQGSYILRQGVVELEEVYGMFDFNWDRIRNSTIQQRLQLLKQIILDPKSIGAANSKLFHPQSGLCARIEDTESVHGGDCQIPASWKSQEDENSVQLEGTFGCLTAVGDGQPVTISNSDCGNQTNSWKLVSSSQLHIATADHEHGGYLCLELNSVDSVLVTNKCLCLDENSNDVPNCVENPEPQWFKLIPTSVS